MAPLEEVCNCDQIAKLEEILRQMQQKNARTICHAQDATWQFEFESESEFIACGGGPWDGEGRPLGSATLAT